MLKITNMKIKRAYGEINYIVTLENEDSQKICIAIPTERCRDDLWSEKENPDPIYLNLVYDGSHYE